jgi:murein L,D-transpeptidase YcbB/YkuD
MVACRFRIVAVCAALAVAGCNSADPEPRAIEERGEARSTAPVAVGSDIAEYYKDRGFRPLWVTRLGVKPEALQLAKMIEDAGSDGLDPGRYSLAEVKAALQSAAGGDPEARARAELLLSRAYVRYVQDLREPRHRDAMTYVDPELAPVRAASADLLDELSNASDLRRHLATLQEVNPLYARLRRGVASYRKRWSALPLVSLPSGPDLRPGDAGERVALLRRRLGLREGRAFDGELAKAVRTFKAVHALPPDFVADAATVRALNLGAPYYERLIAANLERARRIPADPGKRFILVDTAGARLWLFENGRVVDSMRTIVGKPGMETPEMAGLIRFAVLNPYWNVPPDLVQHNLAKRAVREGVGTIRRQRLQVLTDWTPQARVLDPAKVNWKAVASGRDIVRVRQLPGAGNAMGGVKFMLPNKLGIYLHDTPDKSSFARPDRRLSSGCVRVEDAQRLSRWLFRGAEAANSGLAEQRVDLPEPVPVYITYMTAVPGPGGIVFQKDVYGRDQAALAALKKQNPVRQRA